MIYVLYSSMNNDVKIKETDMKLKPRTRAGLRALHKLSMSDTNDVLYGNAEGKSRGRKVSYRAKYKGNFNGGGANGTSRNTRQ
jgi:hypothetical protein